MSLRVGLLYNVKGSPKDQVPRDYYAEWDDPATIEALRAALARKHTVLPIEADEEAYGRLREAAPDIVFNVAEGIHGSGREAQFPAILELLRIPYTGSDPVTLAISLDKRRTREVLSANGVATPRQVLVESLAGIPSARDRLRAERAMIKPLAEGSSKGIPNSALVESEEEWTAAVKDVLTKYDQAAVAEEFLPGREFTAALLGNGEEARVLPLVEINLAILPDDLHPIYSYEAKWIVDRPEDPIDIFACPARIPDALADEIRTTTLAAYRALGCRDWSRIDVRLDAGGRPRILEINPLPGILPNPEENSCYPKAARKAGLSYTEMIHAVLDAARRRVGLP